MDVLNESTVKTFLTLVRVGSVMETASQLYLSPQAVRKQLAQMEQSLGYTLLHRERGNLTLTEVGEIYYRAFSQATDIISAAHWEAEKKAAGWGNKLFIGLPELLDLQDLSRVMLRRFQAEHPDIQMVYRSAPHWDILNWLEDGKVDAAFTFVNEMQGRNDFDYIEIDRLEEMLVVSAYHPKATPDADYLDFRNEPVFYTPAANGDSTEFQLRMENIGFPTDKLMAKENMVSSCAAVEQLQGVTFLLETCKMLNSKTFCTYPTHKCITMALAWRKDNRKRAVYHLAKAVVQYLNKN